MEPYGGKAVTLAIIIVAIILVAAQLNDSQNYSDAPDVVEVPIMLDLSGDRADEGNEYLRGIQIALDDVNSSGGRQFVPVVYDTQGSMDVMAECFDEIMEKGYRCMLGPMDAEEADYIVSTGYDICALTFSLSATQFSEYKNIYRNVLTNHQLANAIKTFVQGRHASMAVLYDDSFESQCVKDDVYSAMKDTGVSMQYIEVVDPEDVAACLVEADCDVVLSLLPAASELDSIITLSKSKGLRSGWMGIDSSVNDRVAAAMDDFYAITTKMDIPEQSFIDKYEQKYSGYPGSKSMYGYDFGIILTRVIDYDGISFERVCDGLENIRYIGMTGFIKFNAEGDCYSAPDIVVSKNGKWETLGWKEILSL